MTFELWWVGKIGRPPIDVEETELLVICREAYMQGKIDQVKETNESINEHYTRKLRALKDGT